MRFALPLSLALISGACYYESFSYACDYEYRSVQMAAEVRDSAGNVLGTVEIELGETRSDSFVASLSIAIRGPRGSGGGRLKGHVEKVRLILRGVPFTIELPTGWPFKLQMRDDIVVPDRIRLAGEAEATAVRATFLIERALVDLETDIPGMELIRVKLQLENHSDWERPSCTGST